MSNDKQKIVELETRFWQSMVDRDAKRAKSMIARTCVVAGPSGAMTIDPDKYAAMTEQGQWALASFEFSDMDVIFPSEGVAIAAYKVRQKGEMKGKPMDMRCADTSTWVWEGDAWKCASHTEAILQG